MGDSTLEARIWWGGNEGSFGAYVVPARDNQTVLDVVTEVQRRFEPSLAYRFSCRVGVCGATLIPLLTLGIPGDVITAIIIGAFMVHGPQPGPMLFVTHADIVYALSAPTRSTTRSSAWP